MSDLNLLQGIVDLSEIDASRKYARKMLVKFWEAEWLADKTLAAIESNPLDYDNAKIEDTWTNVKGLKQKESQALVQALKDVRKAALVQFAKKEILPQRTTTKARTKKRYSVPVRVKG